MSPPANIQRLHTPRTAATVLGEIREALGDLHLATVSLLACEQDADDRCAEAEQRLEDLRLELDARVQSALGLSVEEIRTAYQEALI